MALMTQVGLEFIARNKANQQIGSFTASVKNLGRQMLYMAGIGGGLYAFKRGFTAVISEASRAEEIRNKFNVVFKQLSGDAAKWAESFGNSVGRATQDVQEWMAGLQDTFVPLGIARDRAFELSKSLTQLAVDVASFNNKADADVIRDFTSALVGNHETVRKYGIIISETAIKQEALNRGMNKTYKELTDLEKVHLRYALIQKGTTDAQGDALRTASSYANQVKRLSGNWKEFKVLLGDEILPLVNDLVKALNALLEIGKKTKGLFTNEQLPMWSRFKALTEEQQKSIRARLKERRLETGQTASTEYFERLIASYERMPQTQAKVRADIAKQMEAIKPIEEISLTDEERTQALITQAGFLNDIIDSENARLKLQEEQLKPQREAAERVQQILDGMRAEIAMVGDVTQSWDRSREFVELHALAIKAAGDNLEEYNRIMTEGEKLFEQYKMAERWAEVSRSIEYSMSTALERLMEDYRNFGDVAKSVLRDILMETIRIMYIRPAAQALAGGLSGFLGGLFTGGGAQPGTVAFGEEAMAMIPGGQAGGYVEHGGLARIHTGENIIPAGAGMNPPTVIINNNSGVQLKQQGPPQFDGRQWVVSVEAAMSESYDSGGVLRNIIEGRQG